MKILCILIMILTLTSTVYADLDTARGDLLEIYQKATKTKDRSDMNYHFGANSPVLDKNLVGTRKIFDLQAGIDVNKNSCTILGDMKAYIKNFFNLENAIQSISQNLMGFVKSAPYILMCYASQTLCDVTKFFRNMANFTAQMSVTSCQEYEKLASGIGTAMRKKRVQECAMEESGGDPTLYQEKLNECEKKIDILSIEIPGVNEKVTGRYELREQMEKIFKNQPQIAELVSKLLGNFTIGYSVGIKQTNAPLYSQDAMLSEYIEKYNKAITDTVEGYINEGRIPSDETIRIISIPGMPLTRNIMDRIAFMNPVQRQDFYEHYATVAGMYALTVKIEEAMKALEIAKDQDQDENRRKFLLEQINTLKNKYDLMYERLTLQKDFLVPMMKTIMSYQPPEVTPNVQYHNIEPLIPKPIIQPNK